MTTRRGQVTMAEGGWLICVSPRRTLAFLRGIRKASDRKQILFAVACYRRIWDSLSDEDRETVRVAERYADGRATWEEMSEATIASAGRATKVATRVRRFVDGACATERGAIRPGAFPLQHAAVVVTLTSKGGPRSRIGRGAGKRPGRPGLILPTFRSRLAVSC